MGSSNLPRPVRGRRSRILQLVLGRGLAIWAVLAAALPARAHGGDLEGADSGRARAAAIRVHTPTQGAWKEAVVSVEFELEQAGYTVVSDAQTPASATLSVAYDGDHGWVLSLEDSIRGVRLEARGSRGASAQVVGLHSVEMVHASRLDLPKSARHASKLPPVVERTHAEPPQTLDPAQPSRDVGDPNSWALDVGVTASNVGRLGPRVGLFRRWSRTELGLFGEAGFFDGDEDVGARAGFGNVQRPDELGAAWTAHRSVAVLRSGIVAAYVFRPGRDLRPSLGVSNEVIVPLIDTGFVQQDPFHSRTQLGFGVAWVPSVEVAARLTLSPKLAVRGAVRVGPAVSVQPIPIVESAQTIAFPRGVAMATVGLVFGRNAGSERRARSRPRPGAQVR